MNLDEYASYDALGLARLVERKEVSPRELAATALQAIEAVNPKLNAVIEIYDDRIAALDAKTLGRGPFRGVPFLIKDVGPHLKGRKTEFCSRLCQGMTGADCSDAHDRAGQPPLGRHVAGHGVGHGLEEQQRPDPAARVHRAGDVHRAREVAQRADQDHSRDRPPRVLTGVVLIGFVFTEFALTRCRLDCRPPAEAPPRRLGCERAE